MCVLLLLRCGYGLVRVNAPQAFFSGGMGFSEGEKFTPKHSQREITCFAVRECHVKSVSSQFLWAHVLREVLVSGGDGFGVIHGQSPYEYFVSVPQAPPLANTEMPLFKCGATSQVFDFIALRNLRVGKV
jgi:hypothetical protein